LIIRCFVIARYFLSQGFEGGIETLYELKQSICTIPGSYLIWIILLAMSAEAWIYCAS